MSLGLKLYYLRTRSKRLTQTVMAESLGIRQATISNIEQDVSQPSLPLLRTLCAYFDVTPTWLLDDEAALVPGPADRWSNRHGLASVGHYLEVSGDAVHPLDRDSCLVALRPGTPIYDEAAARLRAQASSEEVLDAYRAELAQQRQENAQLRRELETERNRSRMRRHGHRERAHGE